jgi:hypothetical protein
MILTHIAIRALLELRLGIVSGRLVSTSAALVVWQAPARRVSRRYASHAETAKAKERR